MAGRRGRNVTYSAQEEPAFIRQFKERVGYQEGPSIEDKRAAFEHDDLSDKSGSDSEEDKPQVVVLRKGDLTAEEAEKYAAEQHEKEQDEEDEVSASGRIMFKKPTKRVAADGDGGQKQISSDVKRAKKAGISSSSFESVKNAQKNSSNTKKLDNAKLLSFDADDDDEDGDDY